MTLAALILVPVSHQAEAGQHPAQADHAAADTEHGPDHPADNPGAGRATSEPFPPALPDPAISDEQLLTCETEKRCHVNQQLPQHAIDRLRAPRLRAARTMPGTVVFRGMSPDQPTPPPRS